MADNEVISNTHPSCSVLSTPFASPAAAHLSACAHITGEVIRTLSPFLIINTKVATGTANATAALGSAPLFITKLVPMIAP